jgi:crotonobetainyl-CoA:carnitine CoA-transferase CaiB-like acyl-CoA transferase
MIDAAYVFVHSMRPSSAERLGIGYAAVAARNPRIVYASAPGYRQDGPYRDRPAYDDVIQGESGNAGITELATGEPRYLPEDPYLVATGYFHRYVHPQAGPMITTSVPVRFSKTPAQIKTAPPTLGEHTHDVLAAMGYSASEIEQMSR